MSNLFGILFGLVCILLAFRVKYHPEKARIRKPLRWSNAQKSNGDLVDHPELQRTYFINYLTTGLLFILSSVLALVWGINIVYFMYIAGVISLVMFMISKQRVTGGIEAWKWVLLAVLVVGSIVWYIVMYRDSKVELHPESFVIEGDFGMSMPYQAIDSAKVVSELPKTKYCKEGYSITRSKKGKFRLKDGSDATFYVLGKEAPYLQLYTDFGIIFVNRKTAAETEQLIEELKPIIGEKLVTL